MKNILIPFFLFIISFSGCSLQHKHGGGCCRDAKSCESCEQCKKEQCKKDGCAHEKGEACGKEKSACSCKDKK